MKVTNRLTHIATKVNFEAAMTEDQLKAAFEAKDIAGFPAMLDIKERTEEHVQFISLDDLLAFAKASGVAAVTYDVTYFPHADQGEVERQLGLAAAIVADEDDDLFHFPAPFAYLWLDASGFARCFSAERLTIQKGSSVVSE